jgi:peptidoglycan/LPS O-acetylase OafA/YrhL
MNRRHDIDALRALAFSLLILYHLPNPTRQGGIANEIPWRGVFRRR